MPSATTESSRNSLTEDVPAAAKVMDDLARAGISIKEVTDKLTQDGVKLFADAFDKLLAAVEKNTQSEKDSREPTEDFPAGIACHDRESDDRRLAVARNDPAFVEARCHALDRQRRGPLAGMARHCRRADRPARPTAEDCQGSSEPRLPACVAARAWADRVCARKFCA